MFTRFPPTVRHQCSAEACALHTSLPFLSCKTLANSQISIGLQVLPTSTWPQRLARRLVDIYSYYVMRWPNGCAVNYLTRCQQMSSSGCDNKVATCDTMEDTGVGWLSCHPPGEAF